MTPDKPADSQSRTSLTLLERLREKDELAWSHFESFYGPIIFRFCISRGVSHDQAEEVKSQCYEAVVKQIESFTYDERRGRFRNWLLTIAARRIADYLNRKKHVQADTRVLEAIETQDSSLKSYGKNTGDSKS